MITDVQLAIFANVLGVFLFLLVVGYHYINANSSSGRSITWSATVPAAMK